MKSYHPTVLAPPEALKHNVECFLINKFSSKERITTSTFPNAKPGIVFHHRDGFPAIEKIITHSGRRSSPATLFLYGAGIESSVMNFQEGPYTVIQVVLKPHALASLFGINALEVKDCTVGLNQFSNEDLNQQLMDADGEQKQLALLTNFLVARLKQANTRDKLIEESLHLIHRSAGKLTVKSLLEYLHLSERQFERRFSQTVGVSPRSYIRVKRFNEALRLIKTGQYGTLTEIAYALNFHDQSHFIRDLKTFTGITPKSLSQKVGDFFRTQAGYSY